MRESVASPDFIIGVVGTGTMGRGIVQVALTGGFRVRMYDSTDGAADSARKFVIGMIDRAAEKGRLTREQAVDAGGRLEIIDSLDGFAGCSLVIEAIVEDMDVKRELFARLEGIVHEDAILATNTSSLSVTGIASACTRSGRVAGYHFFNPVPLLKLVEVVAGEVTDPEVVAVLDSVARRFGHEPVHTRDTPGFLVNHAGRGLYTEGARILAEGIAEPHQVDDVMRECAGFRMGPFELMDVTGLDVSGVVMESIYSQFYQEPRFRPQAFIRNRMSAGLFGRKSGRGFYVYDGNRKVEPEIPVPPSKLPKTVWVGGDNAPVLADFLKSVVDVEMGPTPPAGAVCMVAPLGKDATMTALDLGIDPERTVAVDTLGDITKRRTLMTTSVTDSAVRDLAHAALAADGAAVTVIHDSPGFVAQRILATIVNIASEIAQMRIATPEDINKAVRLGLAYPKGPLEIGDMLGPRTIMSILGAMQEFYGDPRYRPSPWLVRRAALGVSLVTAET